MEYLDPTVRTCKIMAHKTLNSAENAIILHAFGVQFVILGHVLRVRSRLTAEVMLGGISRLVRINPKHST